MTGWFIRRTRAIAVITALLASASIISTTRAGEAVGRPLRGVRLALDEPTRIGEVQPGDAPALVPGELVVTFRASATTTARHRAVALVSGDLAGRPLHGRVQLVHIPPRADPLRASRVLEGSPAVAIAEPNWILRSFETIPDDPGIPLQWGLRNVGQEHPVTDPPPASVSGQTGADADVTQAWDLTMGDPSSVIAVVDTGVQTTHPDLQANIWVNADEIPANGVDDDANGFVDDVNGWDMVADDNNPADSNGHGTHVAGIIAAAANNAVGIAGVCPSCVVMPIRAGAGSFTSYDVIQSIYYAAENGADIINMSLAGSAWSAQQRDAIAWAEQNGVLTIAAAGNDFRNNDWLRWTNKGPLGPSYPASYGVESVISVAASNDYDEYGYSTGCALQGGDSACFFTNYGRESVDVAAPGVDIYSTVASSQYDTFNGTSMAAPFVAGLAGLVKSEHPTYTPADLKAAVLNSADHPDYLAGGFTVTNGRVNALGALSASTTDGSTTTDGSPTGALSLKRFRTGSLSMPRDVNDFYMKRLQKGVKYKVSLRVPSNGDFDLYVWKGGTIDTWQTDYGCGKLLGCSQVKFDASAGKGRDELVTFTARRTGPFFIHVTTFKGKGSYSLKISRA